MADQLQRISAMDGELRLWRDIGSGAHAEVVAIDGPVEAQIQHGDEFLALATEIAECVCVGLHGLAATGVITVTDVDDVTPCGPYQDGDTLTLNDGVNPAVTFEFYTAGEFAYGAILVGDRLADGDTVEVGDGLGAPLVFEFTSDPAHYSGPHLPVERVISDIDPIYTDTPATANHLRDALNASGLAVTALIDIEYGADTVQILNDAMGVAGNVPVVRAVAWADPDAALMVAGMTAGADDTADNVTPGNVPVPLDADPLAALAAAINATTDLDITATVVDDELRLVNDYAGAFGNVPLLYTETVAGTWVVFGMLGGADPTEGRTTPQNWVIPLALANTEYTVVIPACAGIEFRARTNVEVRYAFAAGAVAGPTDPYLTLQAGEQYAVVTQLAAFTLYLASAVAGTVIEGLIYA